MTSYEELTPEQQAQVDKALTMEWVGMSLDDKNKSVLREALSALLLAGALSVGISFLAPDKFSIKSTWNGGNNDHEL